MERNLILLLKQNKKDNPDLKRYKALIHYYFSVNSGVFFAESFSSKINQLYDVYKLYPQISAKCANEMIGNTFNSESNKISSEIFNETFYECKLNDIQISSFIEHKARLTILKSAIDFKLFKSAGNIEKADTTIKFFDVEFSISDLLPGSFVNGLEIISREKYFPRYAIFWQWFMWFFGGFILVDHEDDEFKLLSQRTGIPIDNIPLAFESYDKLFPVPGGWFKGISSSSSINELKLFPVPFKGIGSHFRKLVYTEKHDLKDIELSGDYSTKDMIKWNNATASLLGN